MYLLQTNRVELHKFGDPPAKYAILSHVWGSTEQSFQDISGDFRYTSPSHDPRPLSGNKIRRCCLYAESQGFEWLWIDTCCIDQSSSAELSEAINSMYQWYARATVCYAYLEDVSAEDDPLSSSSSFETSKWFTRGWTLQELIAPKCVLFLSREWICLGDKIFFASLVEQITGIDINVLTCRVRPSSVPVATRMAWASKRKTTRVEDEAYCLMGLFGVHMATIYGEGKQAFRRLQEEIIKNIPDHTLLTWGMGAQAQSLVDKSLYPPSGRRNLLAHSPDDFSRDSPQSFTTCHVSTYWSALQQLTEAHKHRRASLMSARGENTEAIMSLGSSFDIPEFTMTSHGIRARLPIVELHRPTRSSELSCSMAILACCVEGSEASSPPDLVGLLLHRLDNATSYGVGCGTQRLPVNDPPPGYGPTDARWVHFDPSSDTLDRLCGIPDGQPVYRWETIYITQDLAPDWDAIEDLEPDGIRSNGVRQPVCSNALSSTSIDRATARCGIVFLPVWCTKRLERYGFFPSSAQGDPVDHLHTLRIVGPHNEHLVVYTFTNVFTNDVLQIHVACCVDDNGEAMPWLAVDLSRSGNVQSFRQARRAHHWHPASRCQLLESDEHFQQWPIRTRAGEPGSPPSHCRTFGDSMHLVGLYVRRWHASLDDGDVDRPWEIQVELRGPAYDALLHMDPRTRASPTSACDRQEEDNFRSKAQIRWRFW
ncbi:heterokaryon incompatibility protein-domain-containing protein [Earliella scabrosa]|nr:heterokaryon incompatibility protein-domain-containing protein [Earliella scabrosa]